MGSIDYCNFSAFDARAGLEITGGSMGNYTEKDLESALMEYMRAFQTESANRSRLAGLESEVAKLREQMPNVTQFTDDAWKKVVLIRDWFNAGPDGKY